MRSAQLSHVIRLGTLSPIITTTVPRHPDYANIDEYHRIPVEFVHTTKRRVDTCFFQVIVVYLA